LELILARHPNNALPDDLPTVFKWREAHEAGITDRRLKRLADDGIIEKIEHGLYRRTDTTVGDLALIEIVLLEREATLCLASALSHADLIDEIPSTIDIALKRGTRKPEASFPITWHWFSPRTFSIGRTPKDSESGLPIASYSPERSICDAYRMRYTQGAELGREALRNWIRRPGSHPTDLLEIASHFPKANSAIRRDLEILL
jgi:predicted transcriptional regulator of viral defense system